jgi:hypothetical protein
MPTFDEDDLDNVELIVRGDETEVDHTAAMGPKVYKTHFGSREEPSKVLHAEVIQTGTDVIRDARNGQVEAAFLSLAMGFGDSGLYVALSPDDAEALAKELLSSAAEFREEEKIGFPKNA